MPDERIYPLTFEPQLRDYIWGGRNLERLYGRRLPPGPVAESWEVSAHPEAPTRVLHGHWQGCTLPEVHAALGPALVEERALGDFCGGRFPLLVKLLDAEQDLSVQVHPDDDYACQHEQGDTGKVECWYILHARPSVELIYGLAPGVDREGFVRAIHEGRVPETLARLPVRAGDCVFVPAGTLHAITAGTVLVEIQQNSDATYRVYDWDRVGHDGRPRALHIEQALDVINWAGGAPGVVQPQLLGEGDGVRRARLVACPQFHLEQLDLAAGAVYQGACTSETFEVWGCLQGEVELAWAGAPLHLASIGFALLPAALGRFELRAQGPARLLRAFLGVGDQRR
jgi:mannose-6-phosphate isomerase